MSEMLLIHDDEWSTIVRILRRIDEFTTDILLCEPNDTEVSGQIQTWVRIALLAAEKADPRLKEQA